MTGTKKKCKFRGKNGIVHPCFSHQNEPHIATLKPGVLYHFGREFI